MSTQIVPVETQQSALRTHLDSPLSSPTVNDERSLFGNSKSVELLPPTSATRSGSTKRPPKPLKPPRTSSPRSSPPPSPRLSAMRDDDKDENGGKHEVVSYGSRSVGGRKPHPKHMAAYQTYESVSYISPDTAAQESQFMRQTPKDRGNRRLLLWCRYGVTGIMVSCVISAALRICAVIEKSRVYATKGALDKGDVGGAWMIWVGSSVAMNLFACFLVLLQPAGASSGIPGLIAFLNGVEPNGGVSPITKKKTSFISLKTMSTKFVGMLCSIPSGLCIGPEGPIIHISALVAYWCTHAVHLIEAKLLGKDFDGENEAEKRDFLATGAACGICTAFRAPLAGTLFVVEEAGSFFTTKHLEFTFFSCLVAYWMQWVFGYYAGEEGATGAKFNQQTGYFCNVDNPLNMVAYLIMSVIGGVIGAAFNQIVEKLNHHRAHHINPYGWRRLFEVLFITLLTGTVVIFLPMSGTCRILTREIMLEDSGGCFPDKDLFQVTYGTTSYSFLERLVSAAGNGTVANSSFAAAAPASNGGSGGGGEEGKGRRRAADTSETNKQRSSNFMDEKNYADDVRGAYYKDTSRSRTSAAESSAAESSEVPNVKRLLLSVDEDGEMKVLPPERRQHLRHLSSTDEEAAERRILASVAKDPQNDEEGTDYYGADVGPGQTSEEMLASLKDHLANHRVVESHRDYKEYDVLMIDNIAEHGPYIHIHYEHTYTCGKASHSYNDMAMLWLNGGAKGVKTLMQRGFPHQISEQTLAVFLVVYFLLAAITSGTHVPAGLVVPMLLIGGSFGRLFGLLWLKIKAGMCENYEVLGDDYDMYHWAASYRWIVRDCKLPDPGTFAVIGMASFMGGSGRISVMLAIVMLELTGDAGLIAPVGIVCILSMLVGNMFNHGLYHGLIPIMNIPYLNADPAHVMYISRVSEIMSRKLVTLPQHCTVAELKLLRLRCERGKCTHNAFPVVRDPITDRRLCGLLNKSEMNLLFTHLESDNVALNERIRGPDGTIDLRQYCDRSPLTITSNSTVSRAYEVLRKLGLRHLCVMGSDGMLWGVVTRKDLMVFKTVEAKQEEIKSVIRLQRTYREKLEHNHFYKRHHLHRYASLQEAMVDEAELKI